MPAKRIQKKPARYTRESKPRKPAASKPGRFLECRSSGAPDATEAYETAQDASAADEAENYETAQEDEESSRRWTEIKEGANERNAAGRRRRETAFDKDMAGLNTAVQEMQAAMASNAEKAARQRTKEAAERLAACLQKRACLEKKFLDAVERLNSQYECFNKELILAVKGRIDELQQVKLIEMET